MSQVKNPVLSWDGNACTAMLGGRSVTVHLPKGEEFIAEVVLGGHEYPLPPELIPALSGRPVLDIGAHVGCASAYFWLMLQPSVIHAYEPDSRARALYQKWREPNVFVHDEAVDANPGLRNIYMQGALCLTSLNRHPNLSTGSEQVEVVSGFDTLDGLTDPPAVIKIDAEGSEVEILGSMGNDVPRDCVVFVEYHGEGKRLAIDGILAERGFQVFYANCRWQQGVVAYAGPELVPLLENSWGDCELRHRLSVPGHVVPKHVVKLMFARFPGGNRDRDDVTDWLVGAVCAAKDDPRIDSQLLRWRKNDTPITMTRNECIAKAVESGADFLCIVDNDMHPDFYLPSNPMAAEKDPRAKPFFESSFDFLYERRLRGEPPAIVGAPYCGPPPFENVFVFQWADESTGDPEDGAYFKLESYTREQAAVMEGIQEAAALPTGLMLIDMRVIQYTDPPYFYYEWTDETESHKASTEDVTLTRDLSLNGAQQFCNWDAWAGHWKEKCVGRPKLLTPKCVNRRFKKRVLAEVNIHGPNEQLTFMGNGRAAKKIDQEAEPAAQP